MRTAPTITPTAIQLAPTIFAAWPRLIHYDPAARIGIGLRIAVEKV